MLIVTTSINEVHFNSPSSGITEMGLSFALAATFAMKQLCIAGIQVVRFTRSNKLCDRYKARSGFCLCLFTIDSMSNKKPKYVTTAKFDGLKYK